MRYAISFTLFLSVAVLVSAPFLSVAQVTSCPNLTRSLSFGSRDVASEGEVMQLQKFLADYFKLNPADVVTGYFGRTTRANVQKFQCEKLGICSGSESSNGYGFVGRMTRGAIQAACGTEDILEVLNTNSTDTPSCVLSVSPSNVAAGGTVRLSWTTFNVTGGIISPNVGSVGANGSKDFTVSETTTFTAMFTNAANKLATCSVTAKIRAADKASCSFNGSTLAHGATVSAYKNSSVAAGLTCEKETRTCSDGSLSGSYTNANCTVQAAATQTTTQTTAPTPKVTIVLPVRNSTVNQLASVNFRYVVENCARTECFLGHEVTYNGSGTSVMNGTSCTTNTFSTSDPSAPNFTMEYACNVMQPDNFTIRVSLTKNPYSTSATTVASDSATIYVRPGGPGESPLP